MRNKWKESRYILLGFIIPTMIMTLLMLMMQMRPFGEFSLLVSDLNAQYIDRITGFRHIVFDGKSWLYTWSQIQGSTPFAFIGVDPFYLFYLLVPEEHLLSMVTIVVILKVGLAGASCAFYLKHTFRRNDLSISIFSWCYALMGFNIAYHFLLNFINPVIILPIILYGVDKIIKNKKDYLCFLLSLTAIFISDYSMAYMCGLFSFLYFIYRYITTYSRYVIKDLIEKLVSFFICPIISFLCSSFILLPCFSILSQRDNLFNAENMKLYFRYDIQALFSKLYIGSFDTFLPQGIPYVYCGLIVLILIGFYFSSYSIKYKEKLVSFVFLAFMFLSLTLNPLYVGWHGFKPPVYFEGRFSYLVSFLMIFIAYKGFEVMNTISLKQINKIFLVLGAIFLLIDRKSYNFANDESLLFVLLCLVLYYSVISLFYIRKLNQNKVIALIGLFVGIELSRNAYAYIMSIDKFSAYPFAYQYEESYDYIKDIVEQVQEMDTDFYRIEFTKKRGLNDGFGIGFPSISHFDSTYNYEVKENIRKLGVQGGHNWLQYEGTTPIVDALLNIKYVVSEKEAYFGYTLKDQVEDMNIFQNPYAVSLGFMSDSDLNTISEELQPIPYQEAVLNGLMGEKEKSYFTKIQVDKAELCNLGVQERAVEGKDYKIKQYYTQDEYQNGELRYELTAVEDGPCYMSIKSDQYFKFGLYVNDITMLQGCANGEETLYLGDFKKGEKIKAIIRLEETQFDMEDIDFYQPKLEMIADSFDELRKSTLEIDDFSETQIKGYIEVDQTRRYLYTSIPYDKGWSVYVDGNPVETQKMMNTFLGVQLTEGKHTLEFKFKPVGWALGIRLSIIGWLIILGIGIKRKINKLHK